MSHLSRLFVVAAAGAALSTLVATTSAEAAQTIVGRWHFIGSACTPSAGAMVINPMSMIGDDFRCDFRDVSRTGDVVAWKGACGFPEPMEKASVTANLQGERLFIRINGGGANVYQRCH